MDLVLSETVFVGWLRGKPVLVELSDGRQCCRVRVEVTRPTKDQDKDRWLVECYGEQAEFMAQHGEDGGRFGFAGHIEQYAKRLKDGSRPSHRVLLVAHEVFRPNPVNVRAKVYASGLYRSGKSHAKELAALDALTELAERADMKADREIAKAVKRDRAIANRALREKRAKREEPGDDLAKPAGAV